MDLPQYEALLTDAETRLDRLRALYDQYFLGMERLEPTQLRKDFERIVVILRKEQPRNTALRFRFQQLLQRNVTLDTYWRKVTRQIEDGTYRRDVLRARRRREGREHTEEAAPIVHEIDMTMDVDGALDSMFGDDANEQSHRQEPVAPLPPPSRSAPPPAPRPISPFAAPSLRPSQPPPGFAPTEIAGAARARESQRPVASKSFRPPKPDTIPSAPRLPAGLMAAQANDTAITKPPPLTTSKPAARLATSSPVTPSKVSAAAGAQPSSPRPAPPSSTHSGTPSFGEQQLRQLFDRYVSARQGNNERTDNVKLESLQKTVEAMLPKLREKHAGKQIDFDVVVRDGKVALKPITK